jgi:serine/threonine protein kinase
VLILHEVSSARPWNGGAVSLVEDAASIYAPFVLPSWTRKRLINLEMTERRCPQCGTQLPPGADVCRICTGDRGRPLDLDTTRSVPDETLSPSVRVGPYKILERLGEGGMGVVYAAEQERPFRRRVALKVIKLGMETREVIARFEAERQALALMDHPCIAQVYDAGATLEGRPYFAMEYVAGIPITHYCDKHRLPMQARLDLFVLVCGAIQHAHQKGVIHRDIKPSNLLVAVHDGKPLPKVIDFGVAKATHQRLTEKTLFTQHGVLIGTPAYMSPEQAEMSELIVDTTTDIYSLGVVLYELLIGALPFDSELLRRAGYAEMQRIIREQEPLRPSARLSSLHAGAVDVALQRQTHLPTLLRELKRDLDWITLKAMDKDRTRRYASASELAADVTRHLKMQPVIARPPSLTYRTSRFLRKHRVAMIAVALGVTVSTVISTAVLTQSVMSAAARGMIDQAALVKKGVLHSIGGAVSDDSVTPWTAAVANDRGVRRALESSMFAGSVTAVAICDTESRVVAANLVSMTDCPTGRPVSELRSVSVLTVLRGTIPSRTSNYVLSEPLFLKGTEAGTIRVVLNRLLLARNFGEALFTAVYACIAQILAVGVLATVGSWLVFRRDS